MMMNKRLLTLVMGLMILFATAVKAEIREVPTEQNGRLSQVAWTDDAGNPVPGPNGYATVKYSYKKKTQRRKSTLTKRDCPTKRQAVTMAGRLRWTARKG